MKLKSLPPKDLAELLKQYFHSFLIDQRRLSKYTINAYRDTFRLFLPYVALQQHKCVTALCIADIKEMFVISFVQYLEDERKKKCKLEMRD